EDRGHTGARGRRGTRGSQPQPEGGPMTTATTNISVAPEPRLLGQTIVVIGGSAGIGLETARLARSEGADVVLTGRNPERLEQAARELSARSSAAFDADDAAAVKRFFDDLTGPIDHVLVAAYTRRSYGPMLDSPSEETGQGIGRRVTQVLEIARNAAPKMRRGGTLLLTGGSVRKFSRESGITPAAFAVLPPFTAALALELAPVRVNLIQAAFVDTALAESYFADEAALEAR